MRSYQEVLDYLYSQLPMFHRVGAVAYNANLDNIAALCQVLGNPQQQLKSIHIAGTNGKGSTSHMLAAVMQKAGYKTGLYTSPHLKDFRERIRIDGKMIPENKVRDFVIEHKNTFDKFRLSFFEMTVGLCFDYFAEEKVDIAIIEVGLGGRLDATNIISPLVSVITNIGYDHTAILGNTLPEIASEKAGVIKLHVPVVVGETHPETKSVFVQKATQMETSVFFADQLLRTTVLQRDQLLHLNIIEASGERLFEDLAMDLTGVYQEKNILTVIETILLLQQKGMKISSEAIYEGLRQVQTLTGFMGRWQMISQHPLTILDTAHNPDGIKQVIDQIKITPHQHLHMVLGMVADKDISSVLKLLPKEAAYYFCKANIPRAMPAEELRKKALEFGLKGEVFDSVKAALEYAQHAAHKKDLVLVSGSTFTVAEVLQ